MTDIGVASPSAQGQAIISTVVAEIIAKAMVGSGPKLAQISALTMAMIIIAGTKYSLILSARRPIGGLEFCAFLTEAIICDSAVFLPTRVASKSSEPLLFSVPAMISSPTSLTTGIGSPVSIDSSMEECPSTTRPSTAIFSPGRTRSLSPITTSSIGISTSSLPRRTRAVLGCRPINRFIASEVRPRAFTSSARPRLIRPMIIVVASK